MLHLATHTASCSLAIGVVSRPLWEGAIWHLFLLQDVGGARETLRECEDTRQQGRRNMVVTKYVSLAKALIYES
jgi:hypothetical protein